MAQRICSVNDCDRPHQGRGFCARHYQRWLRHGDPLGGDPDRGPYRTKPRRICSVKGCERLHEANGFCNLHYQRWRVHGSPHGGGRKSSPEEQRAFFEQALLLDTDDCIVWPFGLKESGYGRITLNGKRGSVHHFVLEYIAGPPPEGKPFACHGPCHNPACLNARGGHVYWGSAKDNADDKHRDGTFALGEKCSQAKLTADEVLEIHRLAHLGVPQRELADQFRISRPQISNIKRARTWAHLLAPGGVNE